MSHSVWHQQLGISLNLTLDDLGYPDRPGLWEQLLATRPIKAGVLRCLGRCYERSPNAPEWMYLRERADGSREAVHLNPGAKANHAGENESDEHKAFKERIQRVTERAGFQATAEARADNGKRVTDVLVHGNVLLGCEVQLSRVTPQTITRRADRARADGITPFWTTDNLEVPLQHRAPWSTIGKTTWHRIKAGTELLVTGGVQIVETDRCGRRHSRCPVTNGRPCGRIHAYRVAARGVQLDDLVVGAAAGTYRVLQQPKARGGANYHWLPAADLDRFLDDQGAAAIAGDDEKRRELAPRPLDLTCDYRGVSAKRSNAKCCGGRFPGVAGAPLINACQLCSNSPTYWRGAQRNPEGDQA